MSTSPSLPKPASSAPVAASSAISRRPAVKMMRGGRLPSPGQYATPRRDGAPPVTGCCQISLPVSGSSATTRFAAGRYMTPLTTIGVAWELTPAGAAPSAGGAARRIALQAIGPGLGQARDVPGVDLRQRRVAGPGQIVAIHRPVAADRAAAARRWVAPDWARRPEQHAAGHIIVHVKRMVSRAPFQEYDVAAGQTVCRSNALCLTCRVAADEAPWREGRRSVSAHSAPGKDRPSSVGCRRHDVAS